MSPVQDRDQLNKRLESIVLRDVLKSIVNSSEEISLKSDNISCGTSAFREVIHPQGGCSESNDEQPLYSNYMCRATSVPAVQSGIGRSVREIARKFYSTTSSVYAEHTISNPNAEQILFWYVDFVEDLSLDVRNAEELHICLFAASQPSYKHKYLRISVRLRSINLPILSSITLHL